MKAKLIVNNKEIEIEISKDLAEELTTTKITGYERASDGSKYYYDNAGIYSCIETANTTYNHQYDAANYYSNETVAKNNSRADRLMRQLRRFAVEHRNKTIDWFSDWNKYYIFFNHTLRTINTDCFRHNQCFGQIYFDSKDTALQAIDEFYDELMWYFTEYKDSL